MARRLHRIVVALSGLSLFVGCSFSDITHGTTYNSITTVKDLFSSAFMLETDEGVVLFDTGYRTGRMISVLEDRGLSEDDVTDVFITHGHRDHIGGLAQFTGARLRALASEADLVAEESGVQVTDPLSPGDVVTVGQFSVEVFPVPGHTAGNAVYLVDGVLLLGDSAFADKGGGLIPTPDRYSDDPEQLKDSVRALAEALDERGDEVEWVVPSHTGGIAGLNALLAF
ncbi:MAG: hypothetical protein CL928_14105 [Deltaproteobacteria bacterium]|nr:hypothetical protein [Deltaproteobacteria bacterium]